MNPKVLRVVPKYDTETFLWVSSDNEDRRELYPRLTKGVLVLAVAEEENEHGYLYYKVITADGRVGWVRSTETRKEAP